MPVLPWPAGPMASSYPITADASLTRPRPVSALPAIARAVGSQTEVLMDGGVRSGVDIFKALALGARGVLIGRPWVWALAAQGQAGVTQLLAHWQRELLLTMTLAGVTRIADINPSHLITPQEHP